MSDSPAKKSAAKKPAAKKPAEHPKYADMVSAAIAARKERGGSSRRAILKYIMANYKVSSDEKQVNTHVKMALKRGAASGVLKQVKGAGANGSFKLGEKPKAPKKKPAKKPAAKKPVKKPAKKPAAKKTPKKKAAAKKPAKKSAAKKPAAKKPAKKPAAKKPAAKKASKKTPKKKAAAKK